MKDTQYFIFTGAVSGHVHIVDEWVGGKPRLKCGYTPTTNLWRVTFERPTAEMCATCANPPMWKKTIYIKYLITSDTTKAGVKKTGELISKVLEREQMTPFADIFKACEEVTEINRALDKLYDYCEANRIKVR